MTKLDQFRKEIQTASQRFSRDIESQHPDFKMNFIIFRRGQRQDEYERTLSKLKGHPCELSTRELFRSLYAAPEDTAFVGIAGGVEKGFLGFHNQKHLLGFVALNIDSYTSVEDCILDLYHFSAQAIDTYKLINKKDLSATKPNIILEPKRNQMAVSRSNLKSDVFSSLSMYTGGQDDAIQYLAGNRARRSLTTQTFYRPEDYPFAISTDVMKYAIQSQLDKGDKLSAVFELSGKIAASFDKYNLKSWNNFVVPAQAMAWNGCTPEQILGAAIHTSSDPLIKTTANLICEITNLKPDIGGASLNVGNPFIDKDANSRNHTKLTEESFELAILHAVETESHLPLLQTANNQNHELLKGRMLGWCADALQAAARTFEQAVIKGIPPASASRIEFQSLMSTSDANWENLDSLNSYMIAQRRSGHVITFSEITNWCGKRLEMKSVMESLRLTLNDPEYAAQLAYVNEVPTPKVAPLLSAEPAPSNNYSPAPTAMPSIGMSSGMGSGMMGTPIIQKKTVTEDQE